MSTRNPNLDAATPPDHSPSPPPSLHTPEKAHLSSSPDKRSIPVRMFDSFRRDPNQTVTETGEIIDLKLHGHDDSYDIESAINNIAKSPLSRKLEARHLQMIAIGGAIGTGLFVGSGKALADGGPGSLLIAFSIVSLMLYCTIYSLGEMSCMFPIAGSFSAFATRFLDPAWGFAMGFNYALQWMVTLPLEIVAAAITLQYWNSPVSPAVWVTIFLGLIIAINLFGVKGYGEAEFWMALIKVIAIIGFIILGIVLDCGGGPQGGYIGGKYFHNPGAFNDGFKGLCSVFVTAAFAFSGTEMVGLGAAETANPRKSLPKAIKQTFWRVTAFYLISLLLIGLLVPYTDPRLLNGATSEDAKASPFVLAMTNAGIKGLPSVFNVVIMIAVLSVGNSSVYGSSRTLAALAEQHQLPRILAYIDRKGRPLVAILVTCAIGLIAYTSVLSTNAQSQVFNWLLALSGLSAIFTWLTICFCHIRFRAALRLASISPNSLPFTSHLGIYGSWLGFVLNALVFVAQFWVGFSPQGYASMSANALVENFFEVYLAAPIIVVSGIAYKLWFKTRWVRLAEIDLVTGRREDADQVAVLKEADRVERKGWPWWRRGYELLC
ncbi:putative amino acid permease [Hyaloscypha variabilis F]|uniref:Putative amino acid permease n=1 Tax=Hyaloscypha variabilis (strain UAMH 11265 / GT02V1 / F) TaxID=1149755 RepID=A0A2J6RYB3_HYAVF|nr:putative amino acid permease [Hyaloscypha variabilis F]